MRSPNDAWTRILRKVAHDVVHRIFDAFSDKEISAQERLTKDLFIHCFQKGKSTKRHMKGITNWGDTHVGREIQVENDKGENEKIFTSTLFKKPIPVIIKDNQCFCSTKEHDSSNFLFRHCFEHELSSSCVHPIDPSGAKVFLAVDQKETLLLAKDKIESELAYKFKSDDKKIIETLRDVFIEELDNKITSSLDKTDKKIDHVSEQIEKVAHGNDQTDEKIDLVSEKIGGQEALLYRIYGRLKRMQDNEE